MDAREERRAATRGAQPARRFDRDGHAPARSRALAGRRNLTRLAFGITEGTAPGAVRSRDAALRRLLMMSDVLAAGVALVLAIAVLGDDQVLLPSLVLFPLVIACGRLMGLYDRDEIVLSKTTLNEAPALFHLSTVYTLIVYLGQGTFIAGQIRPFQGLCLWAAFFAANVACRALIRRLGVQHAAPERCLVVGDAGEVERVRETLQHGWALNAEVAASVAPDGVPTDGAGRKLLADLVAQHQIHRVIVATEALGTERFLSIVRDMKGVGVKVSVKPRLLDVVGSAVEFEDIHGDVFLGIRRFGLSSGERRLKRAIDLVGSTLLLILTAPLLAVIATAIKVDSRGKVFFRQTRVGRDGEPFCIWKFRTMDPDAEARRGALAQHNEAGDGLFKMAADPRVTRVGRFLRRTSLDELPQLLNVLRGDMSLVGPRPLILEEDQRVEGWHRRRLHLTPGMTGMWQVLGSARIPLDQMVALDYLYIVNWSVWNDVRILCRTVGFVLGRRGQ